MFSTLLENFQSFYSSLFLSSAISFSLDLKFVIYERVKKNSYNLLSVTGYTGFVPRARPRLGMGYPIITHEALNEFTSDTKRLTDIKEQGITIHREERPIKDSRLIYPVESGLVPHYTGHIPGK